MKKGSIHIGTSGWSYKHWIDRLYPKSLKPTDYLAFYAQHFATTEINTSFYHLPTAETLQHWADTVNKGFYFCPKMNRFITHMKKLNDPDTTLPKFFNVFDTVKRRLGPVLIQLPPNLGFHAEKAGLFYDAIKQYKGYHFAVEGRHESWLGEGSIALMKKHKIAFVIAEMGLIRPYAEYVTSRHVYLRFHGKTGCNYSYTDEELAVYADKCNNWAKAGLTVWVFFNNDCEGYAVNNAKTLIAMVEKLKM